MFHENEDIVMKALCICSGGSSCWHRFASFVRAEKSHSHVGPLFWLRTLLVVLLAGKASCNQTSAAPTSFTTAQTSAVQYIINVTVNVNGQQMTEPEIKAWLVSMFQNMPESCTSPGYITTTATTNYTQTATATSVELNNSTTSNTTTTTSTLQRNTTTATSTVESNTTTAASTVESNTTTAASTVESNTTTATSALQSYTTTATSALQSYTTTATSTVESNTTTAASTVESNTTTATSALQSYTTTATSTVQNNNTTSNTTTATSALQSTTTTATSTVESNTITATSTLQSYTTTVTSTVQNNNTTTATSALQSTTTTATSTVQNNTTTITTPTTLESSKTSTATTMLQSNNTTTATTPTTLESSKTTTATTPTTLESSKTTTATTPTILGSSKTTTATTPTTLGSSKTTTATTPTTLGSSKTTTATTPRSLGSSKTTIAPTPTTTLISTTLQTSIQTNLLATPTQTTETTESTLTSSSQRRRSLRLVRDVGSSVTQISGVSNNTTTGLFQTIEISCVTNTSVTNTECSVTLELTQTVPACCILRMLCAASSTSPNISVVGNEVHREPQSECNSSPQEENSCNYTGLANKSCEASSYVAGQTNPSNCNQVIASNDCSCSSYCHNTDAYYTFQISIQNPEPNGLDVSSLISQTLKQAHNCTQNSTVSCPLFVFGDTYKDASVMCGNDVTDRQNCSVILHFTSEVPICAVAAAVNDAFQSQDQISFNGLVTRTAICGKANISNSSLMSQFTWFNLAVNATMFCLGIQEFTELVCQNAEDVVVLLVEQCSQMLSTSASPDVTTVQLPPTTTSSPLNTSDKPLNATTTATSTVNTATATTTNGPGSLTTANNETAESQANALLDLTRDMSKLNSTQIDQLVSQLEGLLSGPNISLALGNTSISIVSNLLNASPNQVSGSSNRIIRIVDTVGLKLVLGNAAETLLSPSVALSVKPADGSNFQETFFTISDPSNVQIGGNPRQRRSVTSASSVPQGSITLPSSLTQNLTSEQQQQATRVQFTFYQKSTVFQDKSLGQRKLNSGILGASVANLSITGLRDNVIISLRNMEPIPGNFVSTCVFWDFTLNNSSGGWSPNGCIVQNSTDNVTVCGCNHLTSFAVLLDPSRQIVVSPLQDTILTFITYIGCGVSAIFLSVTLLTYLSFEKLRRDIPSKILIQLCCSLLLLNLVFLVDAWLALYTDTVGLCISTAWFLHYFLLVSFTWMGLEAVHMYQALVKVFNNNMSHYMLKFSLVGWGIPMIVVIVVIAVDKNNYGLVSYGKFTDGRNDDFCWLKNDIAFYVAVVAYFCVIFLFNLIMFIVVLVQLSRIKRQNPHNVRHRTTLEDMRSVAGITVLLGLTWGFAFFAWGPVNLAFMYLFAIFNSFQGLFIFVFYCAMKEAVKRQWRTYLCCGNLRLAENSDWSRTATQKNVKKSQTNLKASKSSQSNSSSSSTCFLVTDSSEQTGSISSPFDDRVITADEYASSDVILNEINSRHRNQQAP